MESCLPSSVIGRCGDLKKCLSQLVTASPGSAQSKGLEAGDKVKLLGEMTFDPLSGGRM